MTQQQRDNERNSIERDAITFFSALYSDQAELNAALFQGDSLDPEIRRLMLELYAGVPESAATEYVSYWSTVAVGVGNNAMLFSNLDHELGQDYARGLSGYLELMGDLFGDRYSTTSLENTFDTIERWRDTPGATMGDLRESLDTVWVGPRPDMAAVTETTRIVTESRALAWQDADTWGFNVRTAEDGRVSAGGRVRDHHQDAADNGPYPWSAQNVTNTPPFGDVNCRCSISPVVRNPNG